MPRWKIHHAKISIENLVNFIRQCYKVDLLIVDTIIEEQYNAIDSLDSGGSSCRGTYTPTHQVLFVTICMLGSFEDSINVLFGV